MNNRDLKQLKRKELIEIIYQLKKNEQELQEENSLLKSELEDKRIQISEAGSIADAAIAISNVFDAAQKAADIYLREVETMKEEAAKEYRRRKQLQFEIDLLVQNKKNKVYEVTEDGEKTL